MNIQNSEVHFWNPSDSETPFSIASKLLSRKQLQEYVYLQKVKLENRNIFQHYINEFDIKNSSLKILKKFSKEDRDNSEIVNKFLEEIKDLILVREVYLNKIANLINSQND
jgi:hypothetical protein